MSVNIFKKENLMEKGDVFFQTFSVDNRITNLSNTIPKRQYVTSQETQSVGF